MPPDKNISIINEEQLEAAIIRLRSDGILHIDFRQVEELSPEHVKEIFEAAGKMSNGEKLPTLITVSKFMHIGEQTRRLWAGKENAYSSAEAMVIFNAAVKLIGNFFIQFHKPARPTRMFNTEEKAINWLRED